MAATLEGVVPGDDVTLEVSGASGSFNNKNVGNGKTVQVAGLTITGLDAPKYLLIQPTTTANITAKSLTVTATAANKVYDGTTAASVTLSTNKLASDTVTAASTSATFAGKNIGTGMTVTISDISISGADAGNYNLSNTTATTAANITKASLAVTPDNKNKAFGTTFTAFSGAITGAVASDGITATYASTGADAAAMPGDYDITATLAPTGALTNYNVTNNKGKLTVTAAATVTISGNAGTGGATLSYDDGGPQTATSDASGSYTITVPFNWSGTVTPSKATYTFAPANRTYTNVTADQTAQDYTATAVTQTLVFKSIGVQDGWVLESGEKTNKGGSLDAKGKTFQIGDDASNRQYKGILSFDTSSLPAGAVITSVQLRIKQSGKPVGASPFTAIGSLLVDIKNPFFGKVALEKGDFQAKAGLSKVGTFGKKASAGWYKATLSNSAFAQINRAGTTQFRLSFSKDDNNNLLANYMKFFSGNNATGQPELTITYTLP